MSLAAAVAAVALCLTVYAFAGEETKQAKSTRPSLDTIKQFIGEWRAVGDDGKPTEEVVSVYRETAGGSAVLETLFPGTGKEMLTIYIQDGEDLVLTHYCVMGNQPRMKAEFDGESSKLVFKCVGGTNLKSENDAHMHEGRVQIVDKDHLKTEWLMYEGGKVTHTAAFEVVRKR
jgi:hypothetical protein